MAQKRQRRRKRKRQQRRRLGGKSPQEILINALNHPVRRKALTILTERIASPKEIADEIDAPLSNVAYHVRVLDDMGLVEILEEESVRGAIVHFYKAVEWLLINNPDWEKLDPKVRSAFSGYLIETLMSDAAESLAADIFDRREDRHLTRTPLLLDEEGWGKIAEVQARALREVLNEQAAAAARLKRSEEKAIHAIAAIALFEVEPRKPRE